MCGMNKIVNLNPTERALLLEKHRELRKVSGNTNLAYRVNAILLLDDGMTILQVARCLFLDEQTIRNYADKYLCGKDTELAKIVYKGRSSQLSEVQKGELSEIISSKIYLSVMPIIAVVKEKYNIDYSKSGMRKLLNQLGFSYKKPKLVGAKANQQKQEEFIESFEKLLAETDLEKSVIMFADASHPQHNTVHDYGWIKQDEPKYVKSNTGRERVNILAAVDIHGQDLTYSIDDTINAISVLELLKNIEAKYADKDKIYFICDNARYFYADMVKQYLKTSKVQILFLPPYSPNLNIIERLWSIMRKEILSNQYYEKFIDFKCSVTGFLDNCWTQFNDKLVTKLNYKFHKLPPHAYA
jgi:transposase